MPADTSWSWSGTWGMGGEQRQGSFMREILSDPDLKVIGAEWWELSD